RALGMVYLEQIDEPQPTTSESLWELQVIEQSLMRVIAAMSSTGNQHVSGGVDDPKSADLQTIAKHIGPSHLNKDQMHRRFLGSGSTADLDFSVTQIIEVPLPPSPPPRPPNPPGIVTSPSPPPPPPRPPRPPPGPPVSLATLAAATNASIVQNPFAPPLQPPAPSPPPPPSPSPPKPPRPPRPPRPMPYPPGTIFPPPSPKP
ncbi:hypothetical protein Vretifemale_20347, partial [Volvox reticuliferus]